MPELIEPKLPPYQPNIGQYALSAFTASALVNAKRQQLENQLYAAELRAREADYRTQIQAEHYQTMANNQAALAQLRMIGMENQNAANMAQKDIMMQRALYDREKLGDIYEQKQRENDIRSAGQDSLIRLRDAEAAEYRAKIEKTIYESADREVKAYRDRVGMFNAFASSIHPGITLDQFRHPENWNPDKKTGEYKLRWQPQDQKTGLPLVDVDPKDPTKKTPAMAEANLKPRDYKLLMGLADDLINNAPQPRTTGPVNGPTVRYYDPNSGLSAAPTAPTPGQSPDINWDQVQ